MQNIDKLIRQIGQHLDLLDSESDELITEMFSKGTRDAGTYENGMIDLWEQDYEIENPQALLADRQNELNAKVRAVGGDNFEYFKNLAAALGYNIDSATDPHLRITDGDYAPFRTGISETGDKIYNNVSGSSFTTWCVRGTNVSTDDILQELLNNQKPAGTEINFIDE